MHAWWCYILLLIYQMYYYLYRNIMITVNDAVTDNLGLMFITTYIYGISTMKRPDFTEFSESKEQRYDLIIYIFQSHNT
jgi:hypothetical protein